MTKTDNERLFEAIETSDVSTIEDVLGRNAGEIDVFGISNALCEHLHTPRALELCGVTP
jgi:hypothetical protein